MGRLRRCWEWSKNRSDRFRQVCDHADCDRGSFARVWRRRAATRMEGRWFCSPMCLQAAIERTFRRAVYKGAFRRSLAHRVPLGLLMLSRGDLTPSQLRRALDEQRLAERGKIGFWFQELGFATEQKVLSALSVQYACPVQAFPADPGCCELIPWALVTSLSMVPVRFIPTSKTLYVAFCSQADHAALGALEHMLDCRTVPCLVSDREMSRMLEGAAQDGRTLVHTFDTVAAFEETTRIAGSYAARLEPEELRVAMAGPYLWVRLTTRKHATDLLFRVPQPWQPVSAFPGPTDDGQALSKVTEQPADISLGGDSIMCPV